MGIEEEIAQALVKAVRESARIEDWAAAVMPLVKRAQAEALRGMAKRVREDFASHGMISPWVGALDDEADRIEKEAGA